MVLSMRSPESKRNLQRCLPSHWRPERSLKSIHSRWVFFLPLEWYHSKPGSREAGSLMNNVVKTGPNFALGFIRNQ